MIYLDNAATTRLRGEVLDAMMPWMTENYGNPSSIYKMSREARIALDSARDSVAAALGASSSSEIYFTSGGSESDNWALKGAKKKGKHLITSQVEHHAILHTFGALEKDGYEVTYLPVDEFGMVNPKDLRAAIRPDTALISIMHANNEVGTIEPIKTLAAIAHDNNILFHCDAVQSVGHIPMNVQEMGADLLSISGHKFNGPKGVGVLYAKKGTRLEPFIDGGGQERGLRAGTENVAGIVGLSKALELAVSEQENEGKRLTELRDYAISAILKIPHTKLNGHPTDRLPNNINIGFEFIEGESLLLMLDSKSVCASSGSACTSGSLDPSHVLLAMGIPHEKAHGSLRLTLGIDTTKADLDYVIGELTPIVERLRAMSPLGH